MNKERNRTWKNESVLQLIEETGNSNPIQAVRERCRDLVLKAFQEGWAGPPYNIFDLCRILRIDVTPNEQIHDARVIQKMGGGFVVEYNPYQKKSRINFSIAHEIGHTLFSDCGLYVRNREEEVSSDNGELEFLCNIAASEIILPSASFPSKANSIDLNLKNLLRLSDEYEASLEAVFLRFCEEVDKPCAIAIAQFNGDTKRLNIKYFKSSRVSTLNLPAGYSIPTDSVGYECINAGWTAESVEQWEDKFGNGRYKIYAIGLPPVKKSKDNRVGIFIVPETYDNKPENEIKVLIGDASDIEMRGKGHKIIAQVINTYGALGFGFGRAMSKKWPVTKKAVEKWKAEDKKFRIGENQLVQLTDNLQVFQMLVQKGIQSKNNNTILEYSALRDSLKELAKIAKDNEASVHMPKIGAGQAKGDWDVIEGMIHDTLVKEGISVYVYVLKGTAIDDKYKTPLSLFDLNPPK